MSPRAPHRFYYPGQLNHSAEGEVRLSAEESHHLLRVLRLRPGTMVDLFDASGIAFSGELVHNDHGTAIVRLLAPLEAPPPSEKSVNIAVALIKRRPMDWLIEKLSELGVDTVQPLLTARCVGLSDIEAYSEPPARWERMSVAAAKQCGRNRPLSLMPPAPVADWLRRQAPPAHAAFAHPGPDSRPIHKWLADHNGPGIPLWMAIGPEGGWTPAEVDAFTAGGFQPVLLGDLTLRAETAALAAAALCRLG